MKTISLKLPNQLARELDETAKAERKNRSEFFREALTEKLASCQKNRQPSVYELTSDLCGAGDSGIGDLSTNPKHFDGFGT
jgi:Arc/MetJ-type ribon-helix-helix transcriptional regulator